MNVVNAAFYNFSIFSEIGGQMRKSIDTRIKAVTLVGLDLIVNCIKYTQFLI